MTTTKPTSSGYYWLRPMTTNLVTMKRMPSVMEVVIVSMNYRHLNKIVPYVIAMHWKAPLDKIEHDAKWAPCLPPAED